MLSLGGGGHAPVHPPSKYTPLVVSVQWPVITVYTQQTRLKCLKSSTSKQVKHTKTSIENCTDEFCKTYLKPQQMLATMRDDKPAWVGATSVSVWGTHTSRTLSTACRSCHLTAAHAQNIAMYWRRASVLRHQASVHAAHTSLLFYVYDFQPNDDYVTFG